MLLRFKDNLLALGCCVWFVLMYLFTGRTGMKQHMPKKPIKWGFKLWVLATSWDSNFSLGAGYAVDFDDYLGSRKVLPRKT